MDRAVSCGLLLPAGCCRGVAPPKKSEVVLKKINTCEDAEGTNGLLEWNGPAKRWVLRHLFAEESLSRDPIVQEAARDLGGAGQVEAQKICRWRIVSMNSETSLLPEQYRSDHLFLLIGTNPLPNFVAAKLLLRAGGQLYLVHSTGTERIAGNLARYWVDVEKGAQPRFLCVAEADEADVRRQLDGTLQQLPSGTVGLNYTGGTKSMSVHAYQAVWEHQRNSRRPALLSYLDARSNKMYIARGSDPPFCSDPVLYSVQPSIQTIVDLHDFKLHTKIATEPILPDLSITLAEAHQSKEGRDGWRTWCDEKLRQAVRKEKDRWRSDSDLAKITVPFPVDSSLHRVVAQMREVFGCQGDSLSLADARRNGSLKNEKQLCGWLDGKWLEHYVYSHLCQIQAQQPESRLHDLGMNICPKNPQQGSEHDVDIGAMQGYRLYVISCTTDDSPGMCKLKLFEAYVRARNLAGDEARVGLVCMANDPKKLEQEMVRSWDAEGKVRVWGRQHLPKFSEHLADWFIGTDSY
jgi:hypothetical protein